MREIKDTVSKFWATVLETGLSLGAGLLVGFLTTSIVWGLLAAAVGMFVAFMIAGQIWPIWMCGPRRDELREAMLRVQKKSTEFSNIDMQVGEREFKLYRKDCSDKSRPMQLELPWKHWRDCLENGNLRDRLNEVADKIHETDTAFMVDIPGDPEKMVNVIDYTLESVHANLDNLALNSTFVLFNVRQPDTRKH